MTNEEVKTIYRFMQSMKLKINDSNEQKEYYEKVIKKDNIQEDEVAKEYNSFLMQSKILKFRFYFLCVITFGLYYKKEQYDYKIRKDILDGALADLSRKYDNIINCLSDYEQEKVKYENQTKEYQKYFKQMDMFIECIDSMSSDEQERFLKYKMKNR